MHIDVVPCQGQHPQPVMFALWEEPKPLATRNQDAFQMPNELSYSIVTAEEPLDWLTSLYNPMPFLNVEVG
jgi:hypothetical protein